MNLRALRLRTCAVIIPLLSILGWCHGNQNKINYLASHLEVTYTVIDNIASDATYSAEIKLFNNGNEAVQDFPWELYFCHVRPIQAGPDDDIGDTGLKVYQINGCLHKIEATDTFQGLAPNAVFKFNILASFWTVARTDIMPNWYITVSGAEPRTVLHTVGETLSFAAEFSEAKQYKRAADDQYEPYSPEHRYGLNPENTNKAPKSVIPTPVYESFESDKTVNIRTGDWAVVYLKPNLKSTAEFLAARIRAHVVSEDDMPAENYISLDLGQIPDGDGGVITNEEAYNLKVNTAQRKVAITGNDVTGVFWGTQTLVALSAVDGNVHEGDVLDYPRFLYRGMHIDVSRNFFGKTDILKLLEVMSMYKMNKLHFHLVDDEGWRLEIPGIEELTEIGAKRCHDLNEDTCVIPQLGSGPGQGTSGTGYYTVAEYQEILTYANIRHIEVIPEFDMPGHGHAAIKAMEARYHKYIAQNKTKAEEFLLSDFNDTSKYSSAQYFTDNAMNPCMESIYRFVSHVAHQAKLIHENIQPLNIFNYGGDEVPHGAWVNSTECKRLIANDPTLNSTADLKQYFAKRVAAIAQDEGLELAAWEDGLMNNKVPMPLGNYTGDVYAYAWSNIWEWGNGRRAYDFANAGYKVVLSHGTHLYFDHPQEPDPEERGFYWATRFTDTRKTFGYLPDDVYGNMDVDRMGNVLDKDQICQTHGCPELEESKRQNVIGIQGQLWAETVRTSEQLDAMIYPRLLATAERAWHKAAWETGMVMSEMEQDWKNFANTLGHRELPRLDDLYVNYYVPPPGVREASGVPHAVDVNIGFPGLPILYSTDNGVTWSECKDRQTIDPGTTAQFVAMSADGSRTSRVVTFTLPEETSGSDSVFSLHLTRYTLLTLSVLLYSLLTHI